MLILFNDLVQSSDAPAALKSPSLADRLDDDAFVIVLDASGTIDCVGVGNTDATQIVVNGETIVFSDTGTELNGLYKLTTALSTDTLTISHDGTYIGRFAAGVYSDLGTSQSREPGLWSTSVPRRTLSGQVVKGAGGVSGREIQVDVKYKITRTIYSEFQAGYKTQISQGLPLFVQFDKEYNSGVGRMPFPRLYGTIPLEQVLQSSVNYFLYSKKFKIKEAF